MTAVCVLCRYQPTECFSKEDNALERAGTGSEDTVILLDHESQRNDNWDDFNHPRKRRALILRELYQRSCNTGENSKVPTNIVFETPETMDVHAEEECIKEDNSNNCNKSSSNDSPRVILPPLDLYRKIHSSDMMDFLSTAWERWKALGRNGRDPSNIPVASLLLDDDDETPVARIPPLIPCNFSLPRSCENHHPQRSSRNVMGQMGYFCNDICTPIVSELVQELNSDARIVSSAVDAAIARSNRNSNSCHKRNESSSSSNDNNSAVVYALCTHPGHHASKDSFGGYCYVNNAALAAKLLQERLSNIKSTQSSSSTSTPKKKIAILDVDYHCGNGTAFIFYDDPNVLVVSIHCHPDFEYPFHSGFGDEQGGINAEGCTLHLPLLPGAEWEPTYREALQKAGEAIQAFGPQALVVSLGLDTHIGDPCVTRGAGFALKGKVNLDDSKERNGEDPSAARNSSSKSSDYDRMGQVIGNMVVECSKLQYSDETEESVGTIPTIVVQEGGYELSAVPSAAADVLLGMAVAMGGYSS